MASETLPAQYLKAGEEYLSALTKLGLYPEFLGWGRQEQTGLWMLALVTSSVEIGGPLALNELLFKAYNLNATPREISPFIVRVFAPRTVLAPKLKELNLFQPGVGTTQKIDKNTNMPIGPKIPIEAITLNFGDLRISTTDVYKVPHRKRSYEDRTREWMRFKSSVEKLAA